jgi:putative transposase
MPKNKTYHVTLKDEDEAKLQQYLRKGVASARSLTRARILLMTSEGRSDKEIQNTLQVSRSTICRIRKRYCTDGLEFALYEKPRCGAPQKIDGRVEAQLTLLACSDPPEGRARWTLELLADRIVELGTVDSISPMSVHRVLKKTR